MSEKISTEKAAIQAALGAKIVRCPNDAAIDTPRGIIGVSHRLKKEIPNSVILDQVRTSKICSYFSNTNSFYLIISFL